MKKYQQTSFFEILKKLYQLIYDSADEDAFKFYKKNSAIFFGNDDGLYYHDTANQQISF